MKSLYIIQTTISLTIAPARKAVGFLTPKENRSTAYKQAKYV